MINSRTKDVFVPYQAGKGFILQLGRAPYLDAQLLRQLQRYSAGLEPWEFERAKRKTIDEVPRRRSLGVQRSRLRGEGPRAIDGVTSAGIDRLTEAARLSSPQQFA